MLLDISDPGKHYVTARGRMINLPFALAETVWILSGSNELAMLQYYNRNYGQFSEDGQTLWGAYGHRLRHAFAEVDQLEEVIDKLTKDPNSRQAVITYWNPALDNQLDKKDYPCNNLSHAMIRNGKLEWTQFLRSNDIIWGMPYNFIQFGTLMSYVASRLNLPLGNLSYIADSLHIYEDMLDQANVEYFSLDLPSTTLPFEPRDYAGDIYKVAKAERMIRTADDVVYYRNLQDHAGYFWQEVLKVLRSFAFFKQQKNERALEYLPSNMLFRYMLVKNYYQWRWHKPNHQSIAEKAYRLIGENDLVWDWITEGKVLQDA